MSCYDYLNHEILAQVYRNAKYWQFWRQILSHILPLYIDHIYLLSSFAICQIYKISLQMWDNSKTVILQTTMFKPEKEVSLKHFHIKKNLFAMDAHACRSSKEVSLFHDNVWSNVSYNRLKVAYCHLLSNSDLNCDRLCPIYRDLLKRHQDLT